MPGPRKEVMEHDRRLARSFKQQFFWCAFKALAFNGIDGDYAEFGCHGGMTFTLAYQEMRRRNMKGKMWGFDSFKGLPGSHDPRDEHPRWLQGKMATPVATFHQICERSGIPPGAYTLTEGFYDETLPRFGKDDPPKNICLAYVDCDLYTSTRSVLEFLAPRLKHGMILAFDDYFCWSSSEVSGERRAACEFFEDNPHWNLERYLNIGWAGLSFLVESRLLRDKRTSDLGDSHGG